MLTKTNVLWVCAGPPAPEDAKLLESLGRFSIELAPDVPQALRYLEKATVEAVLANFPVPDWTAAEFLEQAQRINPSVPVMIRDRDGTLGDAVRLTRLGAHQFFGEELDPEELVQQLETAAEDRRSRELALLGEWLSHEPWRKWLVGESRAIQNVVEIIRLVGSRRCTVLVTGETGTGKEMVARALHMASPRAHLPTVIVNCSALPENLLEAELFGHVRGAFTGAINHRTGRFEQANGSTLFLDEIGDMPLELQTKLLRVLQEREFQRLGSSETIRVDIRVVAASNFNLLERVKQGKFREDLYYRLNVVPIEMPPLRARLSDVPVLVHHFIDKICRLEDIRPKQIQRETFERLCCYSWPGNVRQVENAVEMAIVMSGDRTILLPSDFPLPPQTEWKATAPETTPMIAVPDEGLDFEQTVECFERSILEQALRKAGGNKKRAADMLRLKRTTLSAKLRSLEARAVCLADG
jgi:DNA-binding NtrC family response regulator